MKILVTGNMGYVGSVVVRHLRYVWPNAEIIGFDAGFFSHCLTGCRSLPERFLDRQIFGDVRNIEPLTLAGCDAVVHLAAISNDPMGDRFAEVTEDINHKASLRLAQLAEEAGVRNFVFASSCSVYGSASGTARTEQDRVFPQTAYARSKAATEDALLIREGEMVVTCLRFATACGMSDRLRLDLVLNDFVASAIATSKIAVLSDGTPWRPLIDVEDMARAIEWSVRRAPQNGGRVLVINAGSDQANYTVRQLAERVAEAVPGTKVTIAADAPPDRRSYRVDFGLYSRLAPAHQPGLTLAHSIRRLLDGLAEMEFGDADFRRSSLVRLRVLQAHLDSQRLQPDLLWSSQQLEAAE